MINEDSNNLNFPFRLLAATTVQTDARTALLERVNYDVWTVEYIISGSGFLEINGLGFKPLRGSIYILPQHSNHRYWPDRSNPWHKIFFAVSGEMVDYLLRVYRLTELYHLPDVPKLLKHFEAMRHLNYNAEHVHQQAAAIFHQFVEETARMVYGEQRDIPAAFETLKSTLDNHLEQRFVLEDYCLEHEFSVAYLIRGFRRYYNNTPYGYLMERRLELAKRLLLHSSSSIKEIAERLCFSNQYYFSNYFKSKNRLSPKKFRNEK